MPKILPNLPEADYHAQTGQDTPLFSYSTAKTIIQKSAYHAYLDHPLLGNQRKAPTAAMDKGSIVHGYLLGDEPDIALIPFDSYRTNKAKEARDEATAAGAIPMLTKEIDALEDAVESIKAQIRQIAPYFFDEPHESELSVRWEMDNGVKTQSRFDWINTATGRIIDLKTTADASPDKIQKSILQFGYDIQQAMYTDCANKSWPEMAGRYTWEFLFVELEPPYMVTIVETDASMSWLGEHKANRAADIWAKCLESGRWPGYGRQTISAPGWAVSREEAIDA